MKPYIRILTPALIMLMAVLLSGCGEQYIVLDPKGANRRVPERFDLHCNHSLLCYYRSCNHPCRIHRMALSR